MEEGRRKKFELQWGFKQGGSAERILCPPTRRPNAIVTPYDDG